MPLLQVEAALLQGLFEGTDLRGGLQEEIDGLLESFAGGFHRRAGAHHVQRHGVGDELFPFFPDLNGVLQVHGSSSLSQLPLDPAPAHHPRPLVENGRLPGGDAALGLGEEHLRPALRE